MTLFSDRDERFAENLRIINSRFIRKKKDVVRGERITPPPTVDGGTPTIVIAAADATEESKAKADEGFICTGVNDEVTINAAVTAITAQLDSNAAQQGGRIWLTEGHYKIEVTAQQAIDVENRITIQGLNPDATIIEIQNNTVANRWAFRLQAGARLISVGFEMRVGVAQGATTPAGVLMSEADTLVEDCRFTRIGGGTGGTGATIYATGGLANQHVVGCEFDQTWGDAIVFNSSIFGLATRCRFRDNSGRGITFRNGAENVHAIDNHFTLIEGDAIYLEGVEMFQVRGNNYDDANGEGSLVHAVSCLYGAIHGNIGRKIGNHGVHLSDSSRITIVGNLLDSPGWWTGISDGILITDASDFNMVQANLIIAEPLGSTRYGINVEDGDCNRVAGNDLGDPVVYNTGALSTAGTNTQKFWPDDGFYGDNYTICGEDLVPAETEVAPAAPTGLTGVAGDTEVALNWTSNTELDMDFYSVYIATASGGPYTLHTANIEPSEFVVTGLTNGTQYWFKVTATDDEPLESAQSAALGPRTPVAVPVGVAPPVPTNLDADAGDTLVSLSWSSGGFVSDFSHYNIYRAPTSGGTFVVVATRTTTTYTDTGLTNADDYFYKISAEDVDGNESALTTEVSETPTAGSGGGIGGGTRPTPTVVFDTGNPYTEAKVNAEAAGTVFGFTLTGGNGGGPRYESATVPVKDNNEYVFEIGAVLDGNGNTNLAFATDGAVTGVKIWDAEWTDYLGQNGTSTNNTKGSGAIRLRDNWELIGCYGHHNKFSAFRLDGDNIVVTGGRFSYNRQYGFAGGNCDDCEVNGSEVDHNGGSSDLNIGGDSGGCKIVHSERFHFIDIETHHNLADGSQGGNGLWTDINNLDTLYDGVNAHDNQGAGIFHEVSLSFEIKNCTLTNNGQDNSGGGIHPVKANIQISNSGGTKGWIHDNTITITNGSLGHYGISLFNSNHAQWRYGRVDKGCLGVMNVTVENNTLDLSGSQWKAAIAITGNIPDDRSGDQQCGQPAITSVGANNRIRNNSESLSGGAHTSTPYIRAGVRVSAAQWAGFGYS